MNNYDEICFEKVKEQLKNLASEHYTCLSQHNDEEVTSCPFDEVVVKKILTKTLSSFSEGVGLENVDLKFLENGIEELVTKSEEHFKASKYNKFVNNDSKTSFSSKEIEKLPLVYRVLQVIFRNTDQLFRQHYFHELVSGYYSALENLLSQEHLDVSNLLPKDAYDDLVRKYAPYVKLEVTLHHLCKYLKMGDQAITKSATLAIKEINECIECPKILREDCYEILRDKLGTSEYKFLAYQLLPIDGRSGFLGDYYKLKISFNYKNEDQLLHLFAKYLPSTNETLRTMAIVSSKKEEFFYKTYIPWLVQLGLEEISNFAPRCHFVRSSYVIILEDVSVLGYKSLPWGSLASYEGLSDAFKQLAKLHASSLLYEEKMSTLSGKIVRIGEQNEEYFHEMIFPETENDAESFGACSARHTYDYFLEKFPEVPGKMSMASFRDNVVESYRSMYECVKKSNKYRNVVGHGDMWGGNVLFQNDSKSRTPCYLIDFQLIRYCPPAVDVLFCLYITSNKETRLKYQTTLINEYYNELASILKLYDVEIDDIYPYQTFLSSCEDFKLSTICLSSCYKQIFLCPKETIDSIIVDDEIAANFYNIDRTKVYDKLMKNEDFRNGIKEILEDLYEECQKKYY